MNAFSTRLQRTTPVGALVEGATPEGVSDLSGNIDEWTLSLFGEIADMGDNITDHGYPYRADDGREDVTAPSTAARVVRGGSWCLNAHRARAVYRFWSLPGYRNRDLGFRLVVSSPNSSGQLAAGAA